MKKTSKTEFNDHLLEVLSDIERSGEPRIITDHGKPVLGSRKFRQNRIFSLEVLKGTVIKYESVTNPVADTDWENLK